MRISLLMFFGSPLQAVLPLSTSIPAEGLFLSLFRSETAFGQEFAQCPADDEIHPFGVRKGPCFAAGRLPKGRTPTQNSLDTLPKL